jgi:TolB protein
MYTDHPAIARALELRPLGSYPMRRPELIESVCPRRARGRRARRRWVAFVHAALAAVAAVCAAAVILPAPAGATFPGKNGRIAFQRFLDPARTTSGIFTIDSNGKRERQLTDPGPGVQDLGPDWSPDGSRLTFQRCRDVVTWCEVWTVGADGTGATRLGPDCLDVGSLPACEYRTEPAYSPSATIGFGRAYFDAAGFHGELDEMDGAGAIVRTINAPNWPPGSLAQFSVVYAPDGRRLVLGLRNTIPDIPNPGTPADTLALYVVNTDGSAGPCPDGSVGRFCRITPVELNGGDHPDWSPDGRRILFRSNGQTVDVTGSQLYSVRPDGTDLTQISHFPPGTRVLSSSYSPNGQWITVSVSGVDGQPDVYVMRTNGQALRPVTRTPDWDSAPDWGPRP